MTAPRTDSELAAALRHVAYEAWMAAAAAQDLRSMTDVPGSIWNVTIEAGLIHARALEGFFRPGRKPWSDDIVPTEFAPAWTPGPADSWTLLTGSQSMLNKHIAHLSWARVDDPLGVADTVPIMEAAVRVASAWQDHLRKHANALAQDFEFASTMHFARNALAGIAPLKSVPSTTTQTTSPPSEIHIWTPPVPDEGD